MRKTRESLEVDASGGRCADHHAHYGELVAEPASSARRASSITHALTFAICAALSVLPKAGITLPPTETTR